MCASDACCRTHRKPTNALSAAAYSLVTGTLCLCALVVRRALQMPEPHHGNVTWLVLCALVASACGVVFIVGGLLGTRGGRLLQHHGVFFWTCRPLRLGYWCLALGVALSLDGTFAAVASACPALLICAAVSARPSHHVRLVRRFGKRQVQQHRLVWMSSGSQVLQESTVPWSHDDWYRGYRKT